MHSFEADVDNSSAKGFMVGEWIVAPSRNLLMRGDEQVRVEPRVMDALVLLAGRAGQLVSKQDMVDRVWKGRYVTDDVVTVTVYALRKALGDAITFANAAAALSVTRFGAQASIPSRADVDAFPPL